jgi:hypothetical protein
MFGRLVGILELDKALPGNAHTSSTPPPGIAPNLAPEVEELREWLWKACKRKEICELV